MNLEKIIPTVTIIILILIITVLLIFNIIPTEKKSGFTELFFVNDLPKTIKINERYDFSFAIHNLEKKKMTYDYAVYLESKKIDQSHITLNHDDTTTITQSFIVKDKLENTSIPISVQLLNKNQEIHFWVNLK